MKRLIFTLGILSSFSLSAQRSQPTLRLLNPSYAYTALSGYHGGLQANVLYANRWPGIAASSHSFSGGVDGYVHKFRSGVGVNVTHDELSGGYLSNTELEAHIAPKFKLGEVTYLLTGISANYSQINIDLSKVGYMDDSPYGYIIELDHTKAYWVNGSVGMGLLHKNFLILAQSHYITQTNALQTFIDDTESRIPRTYQFYVSQSFDVSPNVRLAPSLQYDRQGEFSNLTTNLNANIHAVQLAAGYRVNDAVIASAGYTIKERVALSYAYTYSVSSLGTSSVSTHEVGIRTTLFKDKAKETYINNLQLM